MFIPHSTTRPAQEAKPAEEPRSLLLFICVFVAALGLTPLLVLAGAAIGFSVLTGILIALMLAAVVMRWPRAGLFIVLACALTIEQNGLNPPMFTDTLPVFYWPHALEGLFERPIGFLILLIFFSLICQRFVNRQRLLVGGGMLFPLLLFLGMVAMGIVHGLTNGGTLKLIVVEVRPFWYMFVSYLLAYNLMTETRHIRTLFWFVIFAAGLKGVQGVYIFFSVFHGTSAGHREIMAHEESFFFVALLLLLALFMMCYKYRPQFYACLVVLVPVVIALVANQRRTDYVALLVGLIVSWLLTFQVRPQARKSLAFGGLLCLLLGGAYVLAFSHSAGSFAAPARSVISVFQPSANSDDASSNAYRVIENYDLKFTERQSPLIGIGFGKPFQQPIVLPNIVTLDPLYNVVPHNTIYWIWMRLGPPGYFALWFLVGSIIVKGCLIARVLKDRYLQMIAIYIVAITFMQVVVAYADYQLFFYRNVIYLGLLVGVLMRLPTMDTRKEEESARENLNRLT